MNVPSATVIKIARTAAGLTQAGAAELVHLRAVQRWNEYERGTRQIDLARWELFLLLTGQHPNYRVEANESV